MVELVVCHTLLELKLASLEQVKDFGPYFFEKGGGDFQFKAKLELLIIALETPTSSSLST